jgi:cytidine deaminase
MRAQNNPKVSPLSPSTSHASRLTLHASRSHLLSAARDSATNSYSPYSKFPVGAALLTKDGQIFSGCNVENASYGLTLCAERTAVAAAVAAGRRQFKALAIVGGRGKAIPPCGACLQVLAEFCPKNFPIHLASLDKPHQAKHLKLSDLLPKAFNLHP